MLAQSITIRSHPTTLFKNGSETKMHVEAFCEFFTLVDKAVYSIKMLGIHNHATQCNNQKHTNPQDTGNYIHFVEEMS
jgi:hypothetical protein